MKHSKRGTGGVIRFQMGMYIGIRLGAVRSDVWRALLLIIRVFPTLDNLHISAVKALLAPLCVLGGPRAGLML